MSQDKHVTLWIKNNGECIPVEGAWSVELNSRRTPIYTRSAPFAEDYKLAGYTEPLTSLEITLHGVYEGNIEALCNLFRALRRKASRRRGRRRRGHH